MCRFIFYRYWYLWCFWSVCNMLIGNVGENQYYQLNTTVLVPVKQVSISLSSMLHSQISSPWALYNLHNFHVHKLYELHFVHASSLQFPQLPHLQVPLGSCLHDLHYHHVSCALSKYLYTWYTYQKIKYI